MLVGLAHRTANPKVQASSSSAVTCLAYADFTNVEHVEIFAQDWSNPQNAATDDVNAATASPNATFKRNTDILRFTDPGVSLPAGVTVEGITVRIRRYATTSVTTADKDIYLYANGRVGDNKSAVATWEATATTAEFGGATDGWGASLTRAEVTATTFGFELEASFSAAGTGTAFVEFAQIRVCYSEAGAEGRIPQNPMLAHAGKLMTRT